jgi:hypothetical protein
VRTFGVVSVGASQEFAPSVSSRTGAFDGEELPWVGDAFEGVGAAIGEWDARAAHAVGDGAGNEDFVGLGECLDALGDVDGDAADVVAV